MISQLGTFDVENYGDLLYPIVLNHLLTKNRTLQLRQYSPMRMQAPQNAGFQTESITSFYDSSEPRTLIVGGGDLLRTDWDVVAHHYRSHSGNSFKGLRRSFGTLNTVSYLLRTNITRFPPAPLFSSKFRARWMNYSAVGPFLIDSDSLSRASLIAYASCGVPHHFAPHEKDQVKRIIDQARFVYLRDQQSAEKLRQAGIQRELNVAPDLAITLSDQFDKKCQSTKGKEIVSRLGIKRGKRFLCFQSKPYPGFDDELIIRELKRYEERTSRAVVLLPIGFCHGDAEFLQTLARLSGGAMKYANVYSVADIMSIIAASDLFVGTSLHGNVTAASYGIRHLLGPLPVDKAEGFLKVMELPPELKLQSWNEMNDKIDFVEGLDQDFFSKRATSAKSKVYRVVEQMLQSLQN